MSDGRVRVRRTVAEKRRIVELTLEPGASVARVAQAEGVNANQVFEWRRSYLAGKLIDGGEQGSAFLPVVVNRKGEVEDRQAAEQPGVACGAIHIELPGRALVSIESGADASLLRTVLESLRR
jgi:transposase